MNCFCKYKFINRQILTSVLCLIPSKSGGKFERYKHKSSIMSYNIKNSKIPPLFEGFAKLDFVALLF